MPSEINALTAGVKALENSVAAATEQRINENEDSAKLMAQNTAAKQLSGVAKNRLNKFYNPRMYKAAPKRALSEEERITVKLAMLLPSVIPNVPTMFQTLQILPSSC